MSYFKLYYVLLNLKKVVIFAYFNVKIYIEFEFFNWLACVSCQLDFFNSYFLLVWTRKLLFFLFFSIGFNVVILQNLNTKQQ